MFSDKYGLTQAVLDKIKTMTRRLVSLPNDVERKVHHATLKEYRSGKQVFVLKDKKGNIIYYLPIPYKIGEVIAVAQSYHSLNKSGYVAPEWLDHTCEDSAGYNNKMFVQADLMPHRLKFTNVKFERLRDISDTDCLMEGISPCEFPVYDGHSLKETVYGYTVSAFVNDIADPWAPNNPLHFIGDTPQTAFFVLLSKLYGKKVLERNPFVLAYTFKLED